MIKILLITLILLFTNNTKKNDYEYCIVTKETRLITAPREEKTSILVKKLKKNTKLRIEDNKKYNKNYTKVTYNYNSKKYMTGYILTSHIKEIK